MKIQVAHRQASPRTANLPSRARSTLKNLAIVALLGFASLAVLRANATECVPGTLSDYEKLGAQGCQIGDKTFSNFQYQQGVNGLAADKISITPGTIPQTDEPGLFFEAKWIASQNSFVSYNVEALPQGKAITGAGLEMKFGEVTGTGRATVVLDLCQLQDNADSCRAQKLSLKVGLSANGFNTPVDKGQFQQPQSAVRVITPIELTPGKAGSVSLDGFLSIVR